MAIQVGDRLKLTETGLHNRPPSMKKLGSQAVYEVTTMWD